MAKPRPPRKGIPIPEKIYWTEQACAYATLLLEGLDANREGAALADCPYSEGAEREFWTDGWLSGQREKDGRDAEDERLATLQAIKIGFASL